MYPIFFYECNIGKILDALRNFEILHLIMIAAKQGI